MYMLICTVVSTAVECTYEFVIWNRNLKIGLVGLKYDYLDSNFLECCTITAVLSKT